MDILTLLRARLEAGRHISDGDVKRAADEIERLRAALEAHSIAERDCPIDGRKTFQIQPALDGDFYCPDCCQWIES